MTGNIKIGLALGVVIILGAISTIWLNDAPKKQENLKTGEFHSKIQAIDDALWKKMQQYTWREGCPVGRDGLSHVQVSYIDFKGKTHSGDLVVNKQRAEETVAVFKDMFDAQFPIHSIKVASDFKGDDDTIMAHNNSSAFNCRNITGSTTRFSLHSYGVAIDINPIQNPYIKGDTVLPKSGKAYLNREQVRPGMIVETKQPYQSFTEKNWTWGGSWTSLKDYQHFEKPLGQ